MIASRRRFEEEKVEEGSIGDSSVPLERGRWPGDGGRGGGARSRTARGAGGRGRTAPHGRRAARAAEAAAAEANAQRVAEAVAQQEVRARRRVLTAALAGLGRAPEDLRLAPLFEAYESAPVAEVEQAAGAVLTLYLRAGTDMRRRLRPVLANAVHEAGQSPLALAMIARLGALAMPRTEERSEAPESEPEA